MPNALISSIWVILPECLNLLDPCHLVPNALIPRTCVILLERSEPPGPVLFCTEHSNPRALVVLNSFLKSLRDAESCGPEHGAWLTEHQQPLPGLIPFLDP